MPVAPQSERSERGDVDDAKILQATPLRTVPEDAGGKRVLRQVTTLLRSTPEGTWWEVFCSDVIDGDIAWERCDSEDQARATHKRFVKEYP